MAQRQVTVVINGEEYVSKAAKEAEAGLTGFAGFMQQLKGKLIPVIDVTKLVEWAVQAMGAAFNAAKQFVMNSIGAYDAYTTSLAKLRAQSQLTGVPMEQMNGLVEKARKTFGLGTVAAIDITAAVAKFSTAAGDSAKAGDLMAAALELGAASGMTAAQVAEGLSSALAGNDEWLNRLGLSNPSVIWEKFAAANGMARGEVDDTTKALAVMTEIMAAGNKVSGVYAERMASGAGEQERLNNRLDEAKVAFGTAIQPLRIFVVQGLTALINVMGPVLTALGYLASGVYNAIIGPFKLAYSAVGSAIEIVGKFTGNKELQQWGKNASQEFSRFTGDLAKWLGVATPATELAKEMGKAHQLATVQITASKDATDKHTESAKRAKAEHEVLKVTLGMTQGALERLAKAAKDQLPPKPAQDFNAAMDNIRKNADALIAKFPPITQETESAASNTKDMAREVETFARGAIDAATSFGVIDDAAARSLNSAVNIASAIGSMAKSGFSFAGAVGVIGGVASIVNTMMAGDAARRALLSQNNTALSRLSKDIGGLKLNVTGEDLQKANTALQGTSFSTRISDFGSNFAQLVGLLGSQGLTVGDLERIGKEMGINLKDEKGNFQFGAVNQLIQGLGTVQLGRVGQGFGDQLEFFRNSQQVNGNDGLGSLQALVDFLRNVGGVRALDGIDVMNDPSGALSQLRAIFQQLGNGQGIGAEGLGRVTGGQFMDLLMEIIGGLTGGAGSGSGGVSIPDLGTSGSSGGGVPAESVQAVIKAMDTSLTNILTEHGTLHARVAAATEGSYRELQEINDKMDTLIAVSAGVDRIDRALEGERRALAVQQGIGVRF